MYRYIQKKFSYTFIHSSIHSFTIVRIILTEMFPQHPCEPKKYTHKFVALALFINKYLNEFFLSSLWHQTFQNNLFISWSSLGRHCSKSSLALSCLAWKFSMVQLWCLSFWIAYYFCFQTFNDALWQLWMNYLFMSKLLHKIVNDNPVINTAKLPYVVSRL